MNTRKDFLHVWWLSTNYNTILHRNQICSLTVLQITASLDVILRQSTTLWLVCLTGLYFLNMRKFDRGLTHFRRSQLHWLDVVDRVRFRVCVQVFRCLHKMAPEHMSTYCQPVSGISGRCHLRSADRGHLDFPHVKLASYRVRSFAYASPSNWNSLPAHLRDNSLPLSSFKRHLKTFLFSFY